ncbi:MAG: hypothetical protein Q7K16_01655 [Candidatus Azambacteria bacterium]|nr:hypothetical protein [Candidatus Azambacteria bacterium]
MSLKEIFKADHFNRLLMAIAAVVVLAFVFAAGVFVGHEKERFSRSWEKNYYGNIMGPGRRGLMGFWGRPNFNAHSGLGQIIKIDENTITVKDQGNAEKTILINERTAIIKDFQSIKISGLKIDDRIIVIGRPNEQGQIEARLIRVVPALPGVSSQSK